MVTREKLYAAGGDGMIDSAIKVALKAHRDQFRKGTDIPYITHPLTVGIMLAKAGCSDEVIAAGILHDTVEDTSISLDYLVIHLAKKCLPCWREPQNRINH